MNTIRALEWRYATKKFAPDKIIPQKKIEVLKKAFNLTPTSYGLEPLRLIIVKNQALKEQLFEHSYQQQQVLTASHLCVFCIETGIGPAYIERNFERIQAIRDTPTKILSPFKEFLLNHFDEKKPEEIEQWATNQVYLAFGNILNVCAAEEIDACPMEGFDAQKYDELLDLPANNLKSTLILPIGYRAKDDMFADFEKVRRPLHEVTQEIN